VCVCVGGLVVVLGLWLLNGWRGFGFGLAMGRGAKGVQKFSVRVWWFQGVKFMRPPSPHLAAQIIDRLAALQPLLQLLVGWLVGWLVVRGLVGCAFSAGWKMNVTCTTKAISGIHPSIRPSIRPPIHPPGYGQHRPPLSPQLRAPAHTYA